MTIARFRRRWTTLVIAVLAMSAVRLVLDLTNRVHLGMTGRQSPPVSLAISTVTTENGRMRDGPSSITGSEQLAVDLATVGVRIDYPIYVPSPPRFVNDYDRRAFFDDADNLGYFAAASHQLTGRVRVVWNGVIRPGHECSWKTSDEEFRPEFRRHGDGGRSTISVNKTLCPLLVPDGHTFQHFVDGVLPKLIQLLTEAPRLAAGVDQFVVYRPRDSIIYDLLERVGITRQRLMLVRRESLQSLQALNVVDTCVTPALHPRLWRRASQLLQPCQDRSNCDVHQRIGLYNESDDDRGQSRRLGEKTGDIQHGHCRFVTTTSVGNGGHGAPPPPFQKIGENVFRAKSFKIRAFC